MKFVPIDLKQKTFNTSIRGYNKAEVNDYLSELADLLSNMIEEINAKNDEIDTLKNTIKHYEEIESTLKKTMLMSQQIKEDVERNSKKEAQLFIAEAKLNANQILAQAKKDLSKYQKDIEELKRQKMIFKNKLLNLLDAHRELLVTLED